MFRVGRRGPVPLFNRRRSSLVQTQPGTEYSRATSRKLLGINQAPGTSILCQAEGIEQDVQGDDRTARFEQTFLPHLDAAHNLARWLMRSAQDAEDVVQEAYLRAFEAYDSFLGQYAKAWLLTIVRNACFSHLRRAVSAGERTEFDERWHTPETGANDPESLAIAESDHRLVTAALERLPEEYREAIVMRELEELSYKEIAVVTGVPLGTVMSRLARGREQLRSTLRALSSRKSSP